MSSSSIKNVLVIGASGNVAKSTIKALLDENFTVTGLTRNTSQPTLPAGVKHAKTDYTEASLLGIFKGQDAIISTVSSIVPGDVLASQKLMVDTAIKAGVKVFFPSEYGIDTSDPSASDYVPFLKDKISTLDYLKTKQDKISWTAIISGSIFDWGLSIPGYGGVDATAHTATIFDGGDILYEATSYDQVGRAIAKSLKHAEITKNQYVYVNSFTVTQNQVVTALEKATGQKFEKSAGTVKGLWEDGATEVKKGNLMGTLGMLAGSIYGFSGLAHYSPTKGLWNEKLGLSQEDLDEFVKTYLAAKK
ncbi:hypothetical protein BROUX41_006616 [Berkeleyomyces rouxiae]|uniref:uncharacterized protein n=1 Tax=Berkeleyomyces rouxiae TaxID=2035830 RepID=UPI003B77CC07